MNSTKFPRATMESAKKWVHDALEHKKYIDFISAALSVPIMAVVLVTNVSSFTHKNEAKAAPHVEKPSPTPIVKEIVKIVPVVTHVENADKESTDEATITPTTTTTTIIITTVPPTYTPYPTYTPMPTTVVTATPTPTQTVTEPTAAASSSATLVTSPQPTQTQ